MRERLQANAPADFTIPADMLERLPPLPTAIESAAYYMALEALTNVVKHAGATFCQVRLALKSGDSQLHLPA